MVAPVWLTGAVEAAVDDGFCVFIEVPTHLTVSQSISETLAARAVENSATFSVMTKDASTERSILKAISQLYTLGVQTGIGVSLGRITLWIVFQLNRAFQEIQARPGSSNVRTHIANIEQVS